MHVEKAYSSLCMAISPCGHLYLLLIYIPQAKLVAKATSNLQEAANAVLCVEAQEEGLIEVARAVATSTARLLIAVEVKADTLSNNELILQVRKGKEEKGGRGWKVTESLLFSLVLFTENGIYKL